MKPIVATLAVVLVFFAGQVASAAGPGPARASGGPSVDINHFAFHPGRLVVSRGATVVFTNSASIAHTATDRGVFDSGHIKPGHSFSVRFTQKGTFAYHCKIHHFMHGKIVVG
jgi:plastocyanin